MARKLPESSEQFHESPHVACAHMVCRLPSMFRIKGMAGWANLCVNHYEQHYADEAHAALDKYGLAKLPDESTGEHVARMRGFVRAGVKKMAYRRAV